MVPPQLGSRWYYSFLSPQARRIYDRLEMQQRQGDWSGLLSMRVALPDTAAEDSFAAIRALRRDRPEYFWLGGSCEARWCGPQLELRCSILYDPQNIRRVQTALRQTLRQLTQGTEGLPTLKRERMVYKRVVQGFTYRDGDHSYDHNVAGPVLFGGHGVCEGCNALLMLALRQVGIPCIKVVGKSSREADGFHCWTIAWIDAAPVHLDATWDAAFKLFPNYFNLSDAEIRRDHTAFEGPQTPVCPGMPRQSIFSRKEPAHVPNRISRPGRECADPHQPRPHRLPPRRH